MIIFFSKMICCTVFLKHEDLIIAIFMKKFILCGWAFFCVEFVDQNYSVFVGLIGHRKSTFINALCGEKMCEVSSNINPRTLKYQLISFAYKNHLFNAIDTPGLDNSDSNNKNTE